MATKKSAGYQIDFTAKTLTITKEFSDNAQDPASKEFGILMNLQKAIPDLTVIRKTHATPRKYVSKSTGETFNCNQFKNLKYENIGKSFIVIKAKTNEGNTQIPLFLRMETAVSFLFAEGPDSVKNFGQNRIFK